MPRLCGRHIPKVETVSSQLKPFETYHLLRFQNSSERILRICTDGKGVVPKNKKKRCRGRGDRKIMNIWAIFRVLNHSECDGSCTLCKRENLDRLSRELELFLSSPPPPPQHLTTTNHCKNNRFPNITWTQMARTKVSLIFSTRIPYTLHFCVRRSPLILFPQQTARKSTGGEDHNFDPPATSHCLPYPSLSIS